MLKYILKRLLVGVVTLFALVTLTFILVHRMPGSPFEAENLSQSQIEQMEEAYGLNEPEWKQYVIYLENLMHGELGVSYKKNISVNTLISRGAPYTVRVGLIAFGISAVIGISIGIWMSVTKSQIIKNILLAYATMGVSVPAFVIALYLMLLFGVYLGLLPVVGLTSPLHYILPVAAQAFGPVATIARLTKSTYMEATQQDYVIMARAKGLSNFQIMFKHVLRNALIPVITYFGPAIAFTLTGSFVIEQVYSIPGIGREFTNAITNRDYTVILGFSVFIGALIIVANLVVDILCSIVDPRIKLTD